MNFDAKLLCVNENLTIFDESVNNNFISGNKIRKLHGILKNTTINVGIISHGSVYSSHLLACAWWANYLDKESIGIVITDRKVDVQKYPHIKLAADFGMKLYFVKPEEANHRISEIKRQNNELAWIPGGGHTIEAANEYRILFKNLFESFKNKKIEKIVLPFGTGTTALGIWEAVKEYNVKVIGISVARSRKNCLNAIRDLSENTQFDGLFIDDKYHEFYGKRLKIFEDSRCRFFKQTGVMVDPIYNAVAVCRLVESGLKKVLYVNTGGTLNNLL